MFEGITAVQLQPRNALVLIARERQTETDAGIVIPSGEYGDYSIARILKLGPGTCSDINDPISGGRMADLADLTEGDRVIIKAGVGGGVTRGGQRLPVVKKTLPFKIDGDDVELINQHDILLILK